MIVAACLLLMPSVNGARREQWYYREGKSNRAKSSRATPAVEEDEDDMIDLPVVKVASPLLSITPCPPRPAQYHCPTHVRTSVWDLLKNVCGGLQNH